MGVIFSRDLVRQGPNHGFPRDLDRCGPKVTIFLVIWFGMDSQPLFRPGIWEIIWLVMDPKPKQLFFYWLGYGPKTTSEPFGSLRAPQLTFDCVWLIMDPKGLFSTRIYVMLYLLPGVLPVNRDSYRYAQLLLTSFSLAGLQPHNMDDDSFRYLEIRCSASHVVRHEPKATVFPEFSFVMRPQLALP